MENEVFWLSMTSAGYANYISRRVDTLKNMSNSTAWMSDFSKDDDDASRSAIYKSMKKAVKYRKVHLFQQKVGMKGGQDNSYGSGDDD